MATIQASDISFLLSGGSSNQTPDLSLGGPPSSKPVSGVLNSLFSDVVASDAASGKTDHRCFYILNKSDTETLYSASVHVQIQGSGGSNVEIGLIKATEQQTIQISGSPTSGTMDFRLGDRSFSGTWGGSASSFLSSLLSSLATAGLGDMSVSYSYGSSHVFALSFLGSLNNRSHPLVEVVNNGLSPSSSVSITRQAQGFPINSVAPLIATTSTPPSGVAFQQTSPSSRIVVGDLGPGDSMPVWVRRITPSGTAFKEGDSVTIRLSGNPLGFLSPPSSSTSSNCWMFVDCNPVSGLVHSECGMLPMPGYTQYFDCETCECVAVPNSSSSSGA